MHGDDVRILGIPRSQRTVASIDPGHGAGCRIAHPLLDRTPAGENIPHIDGPPSPQMEQHGKRFHCIIVVRVRPRTSRSITDLLLTLACGHLAACTGALEQQ